MEIPVEKWYQAIQVRCSRRNYTGDSINEDMLSSLANFCNILNSSIKDARAVIVTQKPDRAFKGAVGSYGKIKGAPAYVAFIGNIKNPSIQERVGYLGECFVLEATSMGLATCWVGGFFKPETVAKQIKVDADEQVLAISPIGYAKQKYSLEEKILSGMAASHNRKSLDLLCTGLSESQRPEWMQTALEAARLAPSAVNRQPWRFSLTENSIKISLDNPKDSYNISKRLDCGIAMLHLEVGALYSGVQGHWEYLNAPDVAKFTAK